VATAAQLYVFYGDDDFSAREELRRMREILDVDGNLAHNTVRFGARRDAPKVADVIAACHTASFFAEPRLVIADGLLERLGGGGRRGGRTRGRRASAGQASDADRLLDAFAALPPTTTVVLVEGSPPKTLLEALPEGTAVREFQPLKGTALQQWAARRAEGLGVRLTPAAQSKLCELLDGYHLAEMAHEIDKLAAYAAGRSIEAADVDALVGAALHYQMWDLTDAVIAGRSDRALQVLKDMDEKSFPHQVLFAVLVGQYRRLLLARAMIDEGTPEAEIGRRLGINHPFPLRKLIEQSGRYPAERLETAYRRFLEADVAVKTGILEITLALEVLIVELCTLMPGRSPARTAIRRG
jgi:DNA polymerase-3 subunit delta